MTIRVFRGCGLVELFNIQASVQEVAEAISVVLNVDVTIIDRNLKRVAATGIYRGLIGESLPENCSFELALKKGEPVFIDNPNISQECYGCSMRGKCAEMATLGYPITADRDLLGVIGLIAFDKEQKRKIHEDYESLMVFLNKLGDLLAGNLKYINTINALTIQSKETKMIIDGIGNGIICTDSHGNIKFINSRIEDYFKIRSEDLIDKPIRGIISGLDLNSLNRTPIETKITVKGQRKSFIIRTFPVLIGGKEASYIVEVLETSHAVKNAYDLIGGKTNIGFDDIIGNSYKIRRVKDFANRVASSKSTVLLRGESGTGKELFSRAIHNASNRENAPFVAINCASIPENLLESELFGYDAGAFTGASKEGKMGKFELANGGTLFLDEIGDLPLHLQPKILRVLQEESFMRLGGKELIQVDIRLIVATNRDLEDMIEEGQFREDLYYRLNVIPIPIPPLRERPEDIEPLIKYQLDKYCNRLGKGLKHFSKDAKEALKRYNWPGNIRELENVIEYLVNVIGHEEILFEDLPTGIRDYYRNGNMTIKDKGSLKDILDSYEEEVLKRYLEEYGRTTEDKERISLALGINLSTLYRKMGKYNLQ